MNAHGWRSRQRSIQKGDIGGKHLAFAVAFVLALGLAACGGEDDPAAGPTEGDGVATGTDAPTGDEAAGE